MTATYSLSAATILLLIINIAGIYQYYYQMPKWFADPPASFEVMRQQTKSAQKFWIPLQLLFIVSFVTAIITNWNSTAIRPFLIYAAIAYVLIIITTAAYFAREVAAFAKIPVDAPKTDELVKRADRWHKTSNVRNALQFIAFILLLIATYKKFML